MDQILELLLIKCFLAYSAKCIVKEHIILKQVLDIFVLWEIASTFLMDSLVVSNFSFLGFMQHFDGISKCVEYDIYVYL